MLAICQLPSGSAAHSPTKPIAREDGETRQHSAKSSSFVLPSILRLLTELDEIIQTIEALELGSELESALCQQSSPDIFRIKAFASNLCRVCDRIFQSSPQPAARTVVEKAHHEDPFGMETRENNETSDNFKPRNAHSNIEAPRDIGVEAPNNIEAPRDIDVETPNNIDVEAPCDIDVKASDHIETEAPNNTEAPRDFDVEAPRNTNVEAPDDIGVEAPCDIDVETPNNIEAPRDIDVEAPRDIDVEAPRNTNVEAPDDIDVEASDHIDIEAPRDTDVESPRDTGVEAPNNIGAPGGIEGVEPTNVSPIPALETETKASASVVALSEFSYAADTAAAKSHWRTANSRQLRPARVIEGTEVSGCLSKPCTAVPKPEKLRADSTNNQALQPSYGEDRGKRAAQTTSAANVGASHLSSTGVLDEPVPPEAQTTPAVSVDGRGVQPARGERGCESEDPSMPPTTTADSTGHGAGNEDAAVSKESSPVACRRVTPKKQGNSCEQDCLYRLKQPIEDFILDSAEWIWQFSDSGTSQTYKALLESLEVGQKGRQLQWSAGSEWVSLVETEQCERSKSSFRYALTTIAFSRWHTAQAQLLVDLPMKRATEEVSRRILGDKPNDATKRWELRRKRVNQHLTRGRKWSMLVEGLGFGILFDAWKLAKSRAPVLDTLLKELPKAPDKLSVLGLLDDQVKLLFRTGKTDQDMFREGLRKKELPILVLAPISGSECAKLDDLAEKIRHSFTGNELYVPSADFNFRLDSLATLGGETWINDESILACLHLSDKLPFVRVGFCIPMHQQVNANSAMPRPFERARKKIVQWKSKMEARTDLVFFFPLLQHNNHFSLLEINDRERFIYHYDSIFKGENTSIKVACEREFPQFHYFEKHALQQGDRHSCGPITIRHARWRMLAREIAPRYLSKDDLCALRYEALSLLQSAWVNGQLTAPPRVSARRRKAPADREDRPESRKSRKLLQF